MLTVANFVGIICVVLCPAVFGFMKSASVIGRTRKLFLFCDALDSLYESIKNSRYELSEAIAVAFKKCDFIICHGNSPVCDDSDLTGADKQIINDFFALLGGGTMHTECRKIVSCKEELQKTAKRLECEQNAKCKLWQTGGICVGLVFGILLI